MRRAMLLTVVVLIAWATPSMATPWDPIWQQSVNPDTGALVMPPVMGASADRIGHVYITGTVATPDGWTAMSLSRYGPDGRLQWHRTWHARSGFHRYVIGSDVNVSRDARTVYVGGAQMNDSTEDAWARLWSYTAGGRLRWTRLAWPAKIGTAHVGSAVVTSVAARQDGVVVGGRTHGEMCPQNGLIGAFAKDGTRRWFDFFEPNARMRYDDTVLGVAIGAHGRIYAVGSQDLSATSVCSTDRRVSVQARSATGGILWTRVLPAAGGSEEALTVDAVGRHAFFGGYRGSAPRGAWLARVSEKGDVVWSRAFHVAGASSRVVALSASPWGSIYVVGTGSGNTFLRRYTPQGVLVSQRLLDRPVPTDVTTGSTDALYVTGGNVLWRMPA